MKKALPFKNYFCFTLTKIPVVYVEVGMQNYCFNSQQLMSSRVYICAWMVVRRPT